MIVIIFPRRIGVSDASEIYCTKDGKHLMIREDTVDYKKELESLPKGELRYTMRNDYMFKAVLQDNEYALRGLLAVLLQIPVESIVDIETLNPIELGQAVDDKTCVLDLKLRLNNYRIINIELQVSRFEYWVERSLVYLCRIFDNLSVGDDYGEVLPAYHIGILDFWLPGKAHEFYSEYVFMNRKNHEIYSDKMSLRVLNLKAIEDESIVKEPKELFEWAKFFKATKWEEIKMLAENNEYIAGTVVRLKKLSDDEKIKMQCEARERYEHDKASYIKQGWNEGRAEGRAEGETLHLVSQVCKKLAKGKNLDEIADELEEDVEVIKPMYDVAVKYAPDYDVEKVFEAYKEMKEAVVS
ncbi:MAG: Rpn family recombination-promoting nuclease/putative transposase [Lachnospiraceae bacterium]|nr:Rpn family recombination-promoting nuclease/putative transposase [Lachnospiraceae bacterium]